MNPLTALEDRHAQAAPAQASATRHRQPLRAPGTAAAAALALLLAACGGGGTETPLPPPTGGDGRAQALAVSQPGELVDYVQTRLRERQRLMGSTPGLPQDFGRASLTPVATTVGAGERMPPAGTLLQEDGVDEADLLKTDGTHLYALHTAGADRRVTLLVQRRDSAGRMQPLPPLPLSAEQTLDFEQGGLMLAPDRRSLAVITGVREPHGGPDVCIGSCLPPVGWHPQTSVQRVDLSDPTAPQAGTQVVLDGTLVGTRRIGTQLVLVSTHQPVLAWDRLPWNASSAEREAALRSVTAADLLPRKRVNGGAPQPLLAETDCWVQRANASVEVTLTTVTVFDLASETLTHRSRCFVGGTEAVYMSLNHLYLASTRTPVWPALANGRFPLEMSTDIHKFSLADGNVQWRASGSVPGHLGWDAQRRSLRMSEHGQDLRVLSFTGERGWFTLADSANTLPSPALLSVLREHAVDRTLQPVATLPNAARPQPLGKPDEQVHAVRFVGTRGYVVTFRMIDPLYVLDLSDPADPRVVGELEVPGFSDHLFPLDERLLLGVGRDVTADGMLGGVQFSLFDVGDPTAPQALQRLVIGTAGSLSALDFSRHGLTLQRVGDQARVALPMALTTQSWGEWTAGLQRLAIDLGSDGRTGAAGTWMTALPLLAPRTLPYPSALAEERSLQMGDELFHLADGAISTRSWGE